MRQNVVLSAIVCLIAGVFLVSVFWVGGVHAAQPGLEKAAEDAARGVAHYILGVSNDLRGDPSGAAREYVESLKYNDKASAVHLRLGSNYARLGRYDDAIRELKRASTLDPQDLQAHYFLALVHSAQKDFTSAAVEYETILKSFSEKEPKNPELLVYLGQLYYSQGKVDKAMEQFEKVYQADPKNAEVAYLIGNFYLDQNRREDAVRVFRSCIEANPFHDGCLNSLAYVFAEDGQALEEAADMARRALEIDPANPAYLDTLGWVHYQKGEYQDALKVLLRASENVEDPAVYDHLGDAYLKLQDMEKAQKYWRMSLTMDPEQRSVMDKLQDVEKGQVISSQPAK